jgi:hypothetical protein
MRRGPTASERQLQCAESDPASRHALQNSGVCGRREACSSFSFLQGASRGLMGAQHEITQVSSNDTGHRSTIMNEFRLEKRPDFSEPTSVHMRLAHLLTLLVHVHVRHCRRDHRSSVGTCEPSVRQFTECFYIVYRKGFPSNWAGLGYWASRTARHLCSLNRPHCSCALRGGETNPWKNGGTPFLTCFEPPS